MTQTIGLDTFSGEVATYYDLHNHSAEQGGTWARNASTSTARFYIFDGKVHCGQIQGSAGAAFYLPVVPASANYSVFCDYTIKTTISHVGIAGRMSATANTYYFAYADPANVWVLAKRVNGVVSILDNSVNSPTSGTYALELRMTGTTIAFYVDTVLVYSETDSAITAVGFGGVRSATTNDAHTGKHIDNFRIVDGSTLALGRSFAMVVGL